MTPDTYNFQYNSIMIERYIYSRPFWKRFLSRFFEKYRITKEEYDKWFKIEMELQTK